METLDENPDDMHNLMKLANHNNQDDIKIRIKDYKVESFQQSEIDIEEAGTKIYESDDEEKNYTKTTFKNNSREEQLKLMPSRESTLGQSMLEMTKFRESCLSGSGQSEFKTNRSEISYQELEERYLHFKKSSKQYEKLYGKYLEKFIVAEKERVLLVHQNKRANILIQKTAWIQAKWDAATFTQRKNCLIFGGIASGILFVYIMVNALMSWVNLNFSDLYIYMIFLFFA